MVDREELPRHTAGMLEDRLTGPGKWYEFGPDLGWRNKLQASGRRCKLPWALHHSPGAGRTSARRGDWRGLLGGLLDPRFNGPLGAAPTPFSSSQLGRGEGGGAPSRP